MARARASLSGAARTRFALSKIGRPKGGKSVEVGIVETGRYPIETMEGRPKRKTAPYIAEVAFWNEFGTKGGGFGGPIPSRPFMRLSIEKALSDERVKLLLRKIIDPKDPKLTDLGARLLGETLAAIMKETMMDPSFKPNAPTTIEIKGSSRPLIDQRILTRAIDYAING